MSAILNDGDAGAAKRSAEKLPADWLLLLSCCGSYGITLAAPVTPSDLLLCRAFGVIFIVYLTESRQAVTFWDEIFAALLAKRTS